MPRHQTVSLERQLVESAFTLFCRQNIGIKPCGFETAFNGLKNFACRGRGILTSSIGGKLSLFDQAGAICE
jgi:hypothetical protein